MTHTHTHTHTHAVEIFDSRPSMNLVLLRKRLRHIKRNYRFSIRDILSIDVTLDKIVGVPSDPFPFPSLSPFFFPPFFFPFVLFPSLFLSPFLPVLFLAFSPQILLWDLGERCKLNLVAQFSCQIWHLEREWGGRGERAIFVMFTRKSCTDLE